MTNGHVNNNLEATLKCIDSKLNDQVIDIRNSCDGYGFSHEIANQMGLNTVPRCFANWLHGWIWWENPTARVLMFDVNLRHKRHIVSNDEQKKSLVKEGSTDVVVGGLPYAYAMPLGVDRHQDTLLALPPHSAEYEKLKKPLISYFDFLAAHKSDFENIFVCIHYIDYNDDILRQIQRRKLKAVVGARPNAKYSLRRMRALFECFEYVTSNAMGSHIAYALSAGCRVSITGPLYSFDESDFGDYGGKNNDILQRLLSFISIDYVKNNFPKIVANDIKSGLMDKSLGLFYIGADRRLSSLELRHALGWNLKSQIVGYSAGAKNRLLRAVGY